ncbi:hypothetical protein QE152_g35232 [Popillia japonica]|uniref:Uncharacterized protein n=1 Tax=Popillia japonica TaxID=7064 RepID=A0AAW1IGM2_POPJA
MKVLMKAVTTFNRRGRDGEEGGCLEDEQSFEGHSEEMRPESLATVIVEHLALLTGRIQRPIDIERRTSDKPLNLKWVPISNVTLRADSTTIFGCLVSNKINLSYIIGFRFRIRQSGAEWDRYIYGKGARKGGPVLDSQGNQQQEIKERIKAAAKVYALLNKSFIGRKEVSRKTKLNIFKSIYLPTLTFGAETWVLTKRQASSIQAMEMKNLRRVKGVTWQDRVRNEVIREELGGQPALQLIEQKGVTWQDRVRNEVIREELGGQPALQLIEQKQLRWFGHMSKLGENRQEKSWVVNPRYNL